VLGPGVIDGRFRVETAFRSGAMGAVYRAIDEQTGKPVALKALEQGQALLRERFDREAETLAQLDHPNIVKYVAHGVTAANTLYLVMEWIDGETVRERLERVGLSVAETLQMARGIADALAAAHARGVVHRDLKPSNLVFAGGEVERVKLIDFGVAHRLADERKLTEKGASVGTPGYMAPEQVRSHRPVDGRADLFALGCIVYEALTGRRAFAGDDLGEVWVKIVLAEPASTRLLRPELPEPLHALIGRLLAKDPEDRPVDARAVALELAAIEWLGDASRRPPQKKEELPTRISATPPPQALTPPGDRTVETSDPLDILCLVLATRTSDQVYGMETLARIEAMARWAGGTADFLADGSAALVFHGPGSLHEVARRGGGAALELRQILPDALIAVTVGAAQPGGPPLMEDAIVRSFKLIEGALLDSITDSGSGAAAAISLDEATARLIGDAFEVRPSVSGYQLVGELADERTG
jgi:serine/threonine protein kinase